MGGISFYLRKSFILKKWPRLVGPKVDHHMMGGGGKCCVSFNDLGAESALADFETESFFLTWKPSEELFFFNLSWPKAIIT